MKNLVLIKISLLAIFIFSACQGTSTTNSTANDATTKNAANNTNRDLTKTSPAADAPEAQPKSDLKPADVDPNKPILVTDVKAAYIADKAAWHGKQVSVAGDYFGKGKTTSGDKAGNFYVSITDAGKKLMATCYLDKEASDEISKQPTNHVFKGTIVEDKGAIVEQVVLKPCEIVK